MEAQTRLTDVKGIAPVLPVANVLAAAAYYRDKLGFSVRPVMPDSADYWVIVERGPVDSPRSEGVARRRLHTG